MDDVDINGSTLEEGRIALNELEKYLKDKNLSDFPAVNDAKQHSQERRLLDHAPRHERLKQIKGSPLGLTLEVLFEICSCFFVHITILNLL